MISARVMLFFCCFKQKTAYEMRIGDWSSDVCSSDLIFDDVAHVDWGAHLPKMYAFWESVLFGKPGFKGDPLSAHRLLARKTPLTVVEFSRWVSLFKIGRASCTERVRQYV